MPINNTKGLEALRALSEGGSAGLSAYKAAQGGEAASRTSALQGALGGMDVADAAAKAQAKYAPKVAGAGLSVGDLGAAANNYLSNAASKLAAQNDRDQANLTLQAESLRRQQVSDKDRALMMQGAADEQAKAQADAAQTEAVGKFGQVGSLGGIEDQRGALLRELEAANQGALAAKLPAQMANVPGAIPQESIAAAQAAEQRALAAREALTGFDQNVGGRFQSAAGILGRDTAGLDAAYKTAGETGDFRQLNDLISYLEPEAAQGAQAQVADAQRGIDMGGQERLRQQAEAFGIDPLKAKGMFREGEGDDLAIAGKKAQQDAYKAGTPTAADRKANDAATAEALGFNSPNDFTAVRKATKMGDEDIANTMTSPAWSEIENRFNATVLGQITGGYAGFQKAVQDYANELDLPESDRVKLITLANGYFKDPAKTAVGSDKSEVE